MPDLSQPGQPSGDCLGVGLMGIPQPGRISGNSLLLMVEGGKAPLYVLDHSPAWDTSAVIWIGFHHCFKSVRRYSPAVSVPWSLFIVKGIPRVWTNPFVDSDPVSFCHRQSFSHCEKVRPNAKTGGMRGRMIFPFSWQLFPHSGSDSRNLLQDYWDTLGNLGTYQLHPVNPSIPSVCAKARVMKQILWYHLAAFWGAWTMTHAKLPKGSFLNCGWFWRRTKF